MVKIVSKGVSRCLTVPKALLILLLTFGLSTIMSKDINWSFFDSTARMEGYLQYLYYAVFFMGLLLIRNPKIWKRLFVFIVFCGVVMSLFCFWEFVCAAYSPAMGNHIFTFDINQCNFAIKDVTGGLRPETTVGNPSFLSAWLLLSMIITILTVHLVDKRWVWLLLPAGLIELLAVYVCGVRSSYLGIVAAAFLFVILRRCLKKQK